MVSADINSISGNIVESYTYDYLGNRTSKTTNGETTYFTTDLSTGYSQVLKAESASETIYYTRGFELISRRAGTDAHYYLFDGGMSVRGLTDETGVLTDTFVFDAFGNETVRTGTTDNSYGFQGEEQDATGLYYLRARYMDPSTGTFTSMDTYAGSLSDPMSLHKYLFANSNPVKYCDPSGHFSLVELGNAMTLSAMISGVEYGLLWFAADVCDSIKGTDYASHFSFEGFLDAMVEGFLWGAIGYPIGVNLINPIVVEHGPIWLKCLALFLVFWIGLNVLLLGLCLENGEKDNFLSISYWLERVGEEIMSAGLGGIFDSTGVLGDPISTIVSDIPSESIDLIQNNNSSAVENDCNINTDHNNIVDNNGLPFYITN